MKKILVPPIAVILFLLLPAQAGLAKSITQSFRICVTLPEHVLIPEPSSEEVMKTASLSLKSKEMRFMIIDEQLVRQGKMVNMKTIVVR